MLIVHKYGGTSLGDRGRMQAAAGRIAQAVKDGNQVVAVVSAQGDTTDVLAEQADGINPWASKRERDMLLAAGEQMSAALTAMAVSRLGIPAVSLTGIQAGIRTDGIHGNARIRSIDTARIRRELADGKAVIVAGFQGGDETGDITTLGRGGSDTTAVALAAALGADLCRIYTDVDGVYDRDPRVHPDAVKFERIGYDEMLALARSGAQVLHDRCVETAKQYGVEVEVASAFSDTPGTIVGD